MVINYSKVSIFIIIFLIWNIVSPSFIDYPEGGFLGALNLYYRLWIILMIISSVTVLIFFFNFIGGHHPKTESNSSLFKVTPISSKVAILAIILFIFAIIFAFIFNFGRGFYN